MPDTAKHHADDDKVTTPQVVDHKFRGSFSVTTKFSPQHGKRMFSLTHKADCAVKPRVLWRRAVFYLMAVYQLGSRDAGLPSHRATNPNTGVTL